MTNGLRLIGLIAGTGSWLAQPPAAMWAMEPPVSATPHQLSIAGGVAGVFDRERNAMVALELRGGMGYAGLHPWLGASWATDGGTFIGGGALYTFREDRAWQATIGFGPGYYERNQGRDLGKHLEFLSFFEVSGDIGRHQRIALRLAHISNGSLGDNNPGTELLTLGYLIPLGQGR